MDAGALDVLHDAADHDVAAVAHGVDVDLDGVLEEPVDEERPVGRRGERTADVALEVVRLVDDLHRAAAEDIKRTHQNGYPMRSATAIASASERAIAVLRA